MKLFLISCSSDLTCCPCNCFEESKTQRVTLGKTRTRVRFSPRMRLVAQPRRWFLRSGADTATRALPFPHRFRGSFCCRKLKDSLGLLEGSPRAAGLGRGTSRAWVRPHSPFVLPEPSEGPAVVSNASSGSVGPALLHGSPAKCPSNVTARPGLQPGSLLQRTVSELVSLLLLAKAAHQPSPRRANHLFLHDGFPTLWSGEEEAEGRRPCGSLQLPDRRLW